MEERKICSYFQQQLHVILERSAAEPDGFRSYFSTHQPKDEEILGLLAVSSLINGDFQTGEGFPSPLEALAALSPQSRQVLCEEFRRELKQSLSLLAPV
jgi:hypothetical protein